MASKLSSTLAKSLFSRSSVTSRQICTRQTPRWLVANTTIAPRRAYSSEVDAPPPSLLTKLKGDVKAAMKAKDAARLAVLRAVLAETLNASKTDKPIKTDAQMVALLRKIASKAQEAADEFRGAGREDLVEKEEAQVRILEEYMSQSGVETLDEAAITQIVQAEKARLEAEGTKGGALLGKLMGSVIGSLAAKDVDKVLVAKIVKEAAQSSA